ncbi:hypothetical protein JR316_0010085 [Psilocybe cubensis]|uniref:Uncharacterized protein n=1 Tax=Psilocybe cubensis TaxID=181762 RepID=A0ACB8GQN2_PSICU|nr:hypothetical protein JR316_0010085 [Psilocybe cubensis]KAH9477853.1 hypothetical protein JR316_0010085 [Psilocybe cubensis]
MITTRKGAARLRILILSVCVTNGDIPLFERFSLVTSTRPEINNSTESPGSPYLEDETPLPTQTVSPIPVTPVDAGPKDYREWNTRTLKELHSCIKHDNCGSNQRKIALLASHWFTWGVFNNWRGGEGVWGVSVFKSLDTLGYTILFAETFEEAVEQHREFPDLVKVVIRHLAGQCHSNPNCVKSPSNPLGIPAWKIFDLEFFPVFAEHDDGSLLGGKWILSANPDHLLSEEDSTVQYIGYSIQDECRQTSPVPLSSRWNQAWLLMKQIKYVYDNRFAWDRSFFSRASHELNIKLVGAWSLDQHYGAWDPEKDGEMKDIEDRDRGVYNLGENLNATSFMHQVGMSKVMIGVGNPYWSPSPYNALCQGVPFINPIIYWDENQPQRKSAWITQHPSLNQFDPPYVYNVHARNWTGFVEAIKAASTTEIASFIPEHMTETAVQARLKKLMEENWRSKAAKLLEQRLQEKKEGKDVYVSPLSSRQRCPV